MDTVFTYLHYTHRARIIHFLDQEIESLESLIDLHSNLDSDKVL